MRPWDLGWGWDLDLDSEGMSSATVMGILLLLFLLAEEEEEDRDGVKAGTETQYSLYNSTMPVEGLSMVPISITSLLERRNMSPSSAGSAAAAAAAISPLFGSEGLVARRFLESIGCSQRP